MSAASPDPPRFAAEGGCPAQVIKTIAVGNYRSLRDVRLSVDRLTAITSGNGSGKSIVYRALRLLVDAAEGQLGRALAREGGLPS